MLQKTVIVGNGVYIKNMCRLYSGYNGISTAHIAVIRPMSFTSYLRFTGVFGKDRCADP
jgi:hypothetical protein